MPDENQQQGFRNVIGFLAPGKIDPQSILPTLDWANETARRDDVAIIGGFASKFEREVLSILLAGRCKISILLARRLYSKMPHEWQKAIDEDRLVVSYDSESGRQDSETARLRNETIAAMCEKLVMPCKPEPSSSLAHLADLPYTEFLFTT